MTETQAIPPASDALVARVDFQFHWRTWALFILLFGYGIWSLHDGFMVYPQQNAAWEKAAPMDRPLHPPHETSSVVYNQSVGVLLTALSIPILIWRLRRSRGAYRLADGMLQAPGHPAIPLAQIKALDLTQWDRKGIAKVEYEVAGAKRMVTLNDMIYHRETTDEIVSRIEATLNALDAAKPS